MLWHTVDCCRVNPAYSVARHLNKDTLRCIDYRKATVLLCKVLHDNTADENLVLLVDTLVEIYEILYADSELRSPRSVLRLHNITFIHGRLCVQLFHSPKAISKRKMFGKYFHSLITHAPILNRIISLRSLNAELQERAFGQANAISKATSNYHPDHIISNVIVRFQVEANREKQSLLLQQNCIVSNLAKALPPFTNTVLPSALLEETNAAEVQAHLERVSDFLLPGQGVWWKGKPDGGIEFLDSSLEASSHLDEPQLHHFRCSNMSDELKYLTKCWKKCIEREIDLPLPTIRRYSDEGELLSLDIFASTSIPTVNLTPEQTEYSSGHEPTQVQDDFESFECETDPTEQTHEHNLLSAAKSSPVIEMETSLAKSLVDIVSNTHEPMEVQYNFESFGCENESTEQTQEHNLPSAVPTVKSSPVIEMETSLAKSLVDIVSNIHLLKRFDNLRKKTKSIKKGTRKLHNVYSREYTSCSQLVKSDVTVAYESMKAQIAEYDKVFYFEHDRLPTPSEYPRDIRSLVHKRNIAQRVLAHEWNAS